MGIDRKQIPMGIDSTRDSKGLYVGTYSAQDYKYKALWSCRKALSLSAFCCVA